MQSARKRFFLERLNRADAAELCGSCVARVRACEDTFKLSSYVQREFWTKALMFFFSRKPRR